MAYLSVPSPGTLILDIFGKNMCRPFFEPFFGPDDKRMSYMLLNISRTTSKKVDCLLSLDIWGKTENLMEISIQKLGFW